MKIQIVHIRDGEGEIIMSFNPVSFCVNKMMDKTQQLDIIMQKPEKPEQNGK